MKTIKLQITLLIVAGVLLVCSFAVSPQEI